MKARMTLLRHQVARALGDAFVVFSAEAWDGTPREALSFTPSNDLVLAFWEQYEAAIRQEVEVRWLGLACRDNSATCPPSLSPLHSACIGHHVCHLVTVGSLARCISLATNRGMCLPTLSD
jgi:hypothetical protein